MHLPLKFNNIVSLILISLGMLYFSLGIYASFRYSLEMIRLKFDLPFPDWWEPLWIFDHSEFTIPLLIAVLVALIGIVIKKRLNLWRPVMIMGILYLISLIGMFIWDYPYRLSWVEAADGAVYADLQNGQIQFDWVADDLLTALPGIIPIVLAIVMRVVLLKGTKSVTE